MMVDDAKWCPGAAGEAHKPPVGSTEETGSKGEDIDRMMMENIDSRKELSKSSMPVLKEMDDTSTKDAGTAAKATTSKVTSNGERKRAASPTLDEWARITEENRLNVLANMFNANADEEINRCVYSLLERIRDDPPTEDELEPFVDYCMGVSEICGTLENGEDYDCDYERMYTAVLLPELLQLLPLYARKRWQVYAEKLLEVSLGEFRHWIDETLDEVIFGKAGWCPRLGETPRKKERCVACGGYGCHSTVRACKLFRQMSVPDRWDRVVRLRQLCPSCLRKHPQSLQPCADAVPCGYDGCPLDHHRMLHGSWHWPR